MKTRVLVALFALLITFGLAFAAHAQGYPLLAADGALNESGIATVSARP